MAKSAISSSCAPLAAVPCFLYLPPPDPFQDSIPDPVQEGQEKASSYTHALYLQLFFPFPQEEGQSSGHGEAASGAGHTQPAEGEGATAKGEVGAFLGLFLKNSE